MSKDLKVILEQINEETTNFGDLKKLAATIKKDHDLAMALWATQGYYARLLSVLIMDRKVMDQAFMDELAEDLMIHEDAQWSQIADWLLANQLNKTKRTMGMIDPWMTAESPVLRKLFWTKQYRLRWTGKESPENTSELVEMIEGNLAVETPAVQDAMNMTAGWIGIYNQEFRDRLLTFGERLGLYKGDKVSKGCTPRYLPEFIRIEVEKRED